MIPRELVERCVDQVEKSFAEAFGEPDPYVVTEAIFQWLRNHDKHIEAMRSRDSQLKFVESLPDEYEARLPAFIGLCKLAPAIIEKDLMRTICRIASENPVGAGRPPLIKSNEDKRKIVVAVGRLQIDGCSLGDAQKRIAARYGIGVRTVEIIWRNRKKIDTAEPRTISDLISAFESNSFKVRESRSLISPRTKTARQKTSPDSDFAT